MIRVENVRKAFGHTTVLDGVDLTIAPGEVVSILGSSGSGKSTLIRCINGLEKLSAGRITVDEFDVGKPKELAEARKRSGTVFQLFNLYPHMTVLANITLAPVEVLKKPRSQAEAMPAPCWNRLASVAGPLPTRPSSLAVSASASASAARLRCSRVTYCWMK